MRTTGLLQFVYLSSRLGRTSSFPGLRSTPPVLTSEEPVNPRVVVPRPTEEQSNEDDQAMFVETSLGSELEPLSNKSLKKTTALAHFEANERNIEARRKTIFVTSLAALSGAMDVICFQRFGCFAHLMTGNTFKCMTAATEFNWTEASFLVAMVVFYTAGAAVFRLMEQFLSGARAMSQEDVVEIPSTFTALSIVLFPIFGLSDVLFRVLQWPSSLLAFAWAFGSGIVNASCLSGIGVVTNAVTGHWNKVGIAFADKVGRTGESKNNAIAMSRNVIAATCLSVCGTTLWRKALAGSQKRLASFLPPSGIVIGLSYFYLFRWYGDGGTTSATSS